MFVFTVNLERPSIFFLLVICFFYFSPIYPNLAQAAVVEDGMTRLPLSMTFSYVQGLERETCHNKRFTEDDSRMDYRTESRNDLQIVSKSRQCGGHDSHFATTKFSSYIQPNVKANQ